MLFLYKFFGYWFGRESRSFGDNVMRLLWVFFKFKVVVRVESYNIFMGRNDWLVNGSRFDF